MKFPQLPSDTSTCSVQNCFSKTFQGSESSAIFLVPCMYNFPMLLPDQKKKSYQFTDYHIPFYFKDNGMVQSLFYRLEPPKE